MRYREPEKEWKVVEEKPIEIKGVKKLEMEKIKKSSKVLSTIKRIYSRTWYVREGEIFLKYKRSSS